MYVELGFSIAVRHIRPASHHAPLHDSDTNSKLLSFQRQEEAEKRDALASLCFPVTEFANLIYQAQRSVFTICDTRTRHGKGRAPSSPSGTDAVVAIPRSCLCKRFQGPSRGSRGWPIAGGVLLRESGV